MDGHGVNGHLVSDLVKRTLPSVLSSIINGRNFDNTRKSLVSGKKNLIKKSIQSRNTYLPPLVNGSVKGRGSQNNSFNYQPQNGESSTDPYQSGDATFHDTWLTSDPLLRDRQILESFRICQDKIE